MHLHEREGRHDDDEPRIVLMLPFLMAAAAVFFGLSPVFYALHARTAPSR